MSLDRAADFPGALVLRSTDCGVEMRGDKKGFRVDKLQIQNTSAACFWKPFWNSSDQREKTLFKRENRVFSWVMSEGYPSDLEYTSIPAAVLSDVSDEHELSICIVGVFTVGAKSAD